MRELGRFDEALALLANPVDDRRAEYAKTIETLCRKGDRYVRILRQQ